MFDKYVEWKILRFFLQNPTTFFYVNEVARKLKVSPASVSNFLKRMEKESFFIKKIVGNTHLYHLNNDLEIIKRLKIFHTLIEIHKIKLVDLLREKDETIISIILYGSFAKGEDDEKSDVDILIISNQKKKFTELIQKIEEKIGKEIEVTILSMAEWEKVKKEDKTFYNSIKENHIVLYGGEPP